jgi:hypothetical protein
MDKSKDSRSVSAICIVGSTQVFEKAGFEKVDVERKAGRPLMRLEL